MKTYFSFLSEIKSIHGAVIIQFFLDAYLDEACCRVTPLLKMFLPVLFLDFEGKSRTQDALYRFRVTWKAHKVSSDLYWPLLAMSWNCNNGKLFLQPFVEPLHKRDQYENTTKKSSKYLISQIFTSVKPQGNRNVREKADFLHTHQKSMWQK